MPDENEIIKEYENYMPPVSLPMAKALDAIRAPQADTRALSRLLMQDTILASKTFKLINSAYFGASPARLTSINKALLSLGAMKVKNIIIALVLQKMYDDEGPENFFAHSIACAAACEFLACEYGTINSDDAFILGFLHDIGMTILKSRHSSTYLEIYNASKGDFESLMKVEKEKFGVSHPILGAKLCEKWKLPAILVDTVKYHHNPKSAKIPSAAGIVYVADRIVSPTPETMPIDKSVIDYLQIPVTDTALVKEKIMAKTDIFLKELSDF